MEIEQWWDRLDESTRQWLMDHNGEDVPAGVLAGIATATGPAADQPWWSSTAGPPFALVDDAVDWIESVANGEPPESAPPRFPSGR